jgi:hypothetical protein
MRSKNNGEVTRIVAKRVIEGELSPQEEDGWLHVAASAEHLSAMQVSAHFESAPSAIRVLLSRVFCGARLIGSSARKYCVLGYLNARNATGQGGTAGGIASVEREK